MTMPTAGKVRVLRRGDGWWHWWCPCCVGGDFATSSLGGGWQSTYTWILGAALAHVRWHAERDRRERMRSMTLTEFLLARIADDELAGLRARDNAGSFAAADHVVRWSPDRVLAECAAKRRLVELHHAIEVYEFNPQGYCDECSDYGWASAVDGAQPIDMPCPTLRLLALPYADHPAYRDEWRP